MNEIRHDHDAEHEAVIRALIDAGADMHLRASNGRSVEHMADLKKLYHVDLHRHIVHKTEKSKQQIQAQKEKDELLAASKLKKREEGKNDTGEEKIAAEDEL